MSDTIPTKVPIDAVDMCCGSRRCPSVTLYSDGSLLVEDEGTLVEFTPEQAARLADMLRPAGQKESR
jgi:hypothetical protein